jgi:Glycosyl transferase family 2
VAEEARIAEGYKGQRRRLARGRYRLDVPDSPLLERTQAWILEHSVEHLYGPEKVDYGTDEIVLLVLLRNGRPYIKAFMEHYASMAVKHAVFLDNGSTDGTVEALKGYDNVTVLRAMLPYKRYNVAMKRYLIERFGRGRWTLSVDMDELFDYPYSDVVSLKALLGYLSANSYTAVVAQMLDMFSEEPVTDTVSDEDEPLKERYRFYDISNVREQDYWEFPFVSGSGNVVTNEDIGIYRNGIQNTVFGTLPALTKHPLVFLDEKLKPVDRSAHSVSNARVADFTCVLFHYKFTNHLYELIRNAARQENYMRDSGKQKKWLKVLEKTPNLLVKGETSRELRDVNDLVENGFLVVSEEYMSWVDAEEEKRIVGTLEDEPGTSEARAEVRTLRTRRLERQVRGLRSRLAEERRKGRSLEETNRSLANRLERLQASRGRRLLNRLARVRTRMFRKRISGG